MIVKVHIQNCSDCRHKDHSGAFTLGGSIDICRHPNSPKNGYVRGVRNFNDITKENVRKIFGPKEINLRGEIPEWCPLKLGCSY